MAILYGESAFEGADVVSKMQWAGGTVARENDGPIWHIFVQFLSFDFDSEILAWRISAS